MLKVTPVSFAPEEQKRIDDVYATGKSGVEMWNASSLKDIRHKISVVTLQNQQCFCAFCEGRLEEGTTAIEHFVPKGLHREFTYEPQNLVSSCGRCNSSKIKGEKETLASNLQFPYSSNTFKIVHPILDNPDDHIVFQDTDRVFFDLKHCSKLGLDTIEFFQWESINASQKRVMTAAIRKLPVNFVQLVDEISTYK